MARNAALKVIFLIQVILFISMVPTAYGLGTATVYAAPGSVDQSDKYKVWVQDSTTEPTNQWIELDVYKSSNDVIWNGGFRCLVPGNCSSSDATAEVKEMMSDRNHWASFDTTGWVKIKIESYNCGISAGDINGKRDTIVHPNSASAFDTVYDNSTTNTFTLNWYNPSTANWARHFYVKLPGNCHEENPLFIFPNPRDHANTTVPTCPNGATILGQEGQETDINPGANDPEILTITQNNKVYCIPGGAYVNGRIVINNADNVQIVGRGILSGIDVRHHSTTFWGGHLILATGGSNNVTVEGITLTDASRANIEAYSKLTVDNVKMLAWHENSDGILGQDDSIINDVFMKVNDDAVKMMYSDMQFNRTVVWQQTSGSVIQMAWNNINIAKDSKVSQLVVIEADRDEGDMGDLNSSLISARNLMTGGIIDFTIEEVITEETPYNFIVVRTEDDLVYVDSSRISNNGCLNPVFQSWNCHDLDGNGRIENLTLKNITVLGEPPFKGRIETNPKIPAYSGPKPPNEPFYNLPSTIDGVTFDNVSVDGKKIVQNNPGANEWEWWRVFLVPGGWPNLQFQ